MSQIELDDNKGRIALRTNGGCRVVLDDSRKSIEIGIARTKGVDVEKDNVTLTLDGSSGDVTLESNGSVSIKAAEISLNATGTLKLNS